VTESAALLQAGLAVFRRAPATWTGLAIITLTTAIQHWAGPRRAKRLVRQRSSNLDQLRSLNLRVLVTSAFWLERPAYLPGWGALFLGVLLPAELWLGSPRWLAVFFFGHIGASVITLLGVWLAIRMGRARRRLAHAVDVGVSYGFLAMAGILVYRLPREWRAPAAGTLLGGLATVFWQRRTFTDGGHLAAAAIGLALYPLATVHRRTARAAVPPAPRLPA
jgi:hypothetical protein